MTVMCEEREAFSAVAGGAVSGGPGDDEPPHAATSDVTAIAAAMRPRAGALARRSLFIGTLG